MAAPSTLDLFFGPLAILVISGQERECGGCRQARLVFVNRDGQTRCWECDILARAQAAQEQEHEHEKDTVKP